MITVAEGPFGVGSTATATAGVVLDGVADLGAGTFNPVSGVR